MYQTSAYPYRVDLHVPRAAISADGGGLAAEALCELLRRRGLSGLVLSEHDALPDEGEIQKLNRGLKGARVYRAAEVSTSEGHCLVIGLPSLEGVSPGLSTWELVKRADAHGAAVILVHPMQPTPLTPRPVSVSDMAPGIHGIEVMSSVTGSTDELEARLFAHERGWTMVGGSDALSERLVGSAFCAMPRLPADEQDLAGLIRVGALRAERAG